MSDTLVLEPLRAIRGDIAELQFDIGDVKHRLRTMEVAVGGLAAAEASHYASLAHRADRVDERLDRIERRLDLVSV